MLKLAQPLIIPFSDQLYINDSHSL